jgi:hypothetical protein
LPLFRVGWLTSLAGLEVVAKQRLAAAGGTAQEEKAANTEEEYES